MSSGERAGGVPLCVDLDGTLVATDTLWESLRLVLSRRPWKLPGALWALLKGKAAFKRSIAGEELLEPGALPFRTEVLALIEHARKEGRPVLLVTAADQRVAETVASFIGLFDEVMATAQGRNLKAGAKRDALVERFGEGGYDYVGDSAADLPVLTGARVGYLTSAASRVASKARVAGGGPVRLLCARGSRLGALVSELRVHQWSKNALLLAPALMVHHLPEGAKLLSGVFAFFSFSLCASAGYVLNDLVDLDADRHHRSKRLRPFASGQLPLIWGPPLLVVLVAGSVLLALWFTPPAFIGMLGIYFLLSLSYSYYFKRRAVLDVLVLAGLYTLRLLAGGVATSIEISAWLLAFSTFLFFSLAMAKRYVELLALEQADGEKIDRRGYVVKDLDMVASMGPAAGYIAVLVFALYLNSDRVRLNYDQPYVLWLISPVLLFWVTRIWFLARRGELDDDPVKFAMTDPASWLCAVLILVIAAAARYVPIPHIIDLVP